MPFLWNNQYLVERRDQYLTTAAYHVVYSHVYFNIKMAKWSKIFLVEDENPVTKMVLDDGRET